jgi:hypothetical protein
MPDNLGAPSANFADRRPHQVGSAEGTKGGSPVGVSKEWLIDTGAQISVVTKDNADQFDLTPTGGSASATTGGGGILIKSGLTMKFEIFDSSGAVKAVFCSRDIGVKPNNDGGEILGMDQLYEVDGAVDWDPGLRKGRIYEV